MRFICNTLFIIFIIMMFVPWYAIALRNPQPIHAFIGFLGLVGVLIEFAFVESREGL